MNDTPKIIGYGRQEIDQEDISAVLNVLNGDYLTQGPVVERFENALAERVGAKYAIACSSGTAGLHLACLAADLSPGSAGVTTTMSFAASANCMLYTKIIVDLLDIDAQSIGLSTDRLKIYVTENDPKLILPVHFAGLASNSQEIKDIASGRIIIEDACHSLGGNYENGRPVGCGDFSDMSVFSFHPVKLVTTGEGGAITTNNSDIAERLRLYRNHGIERNPDNFMNIEAKEDGPLPWYYEQQKLGFNYRLSEIQAALGLSQLKKLDKFVARRREIAAFYDAELKDLPLSLIQAQSEARKRSGMHLYIISVDWEALGITRADVMLSLREEGIGSQVHYIPIHMQPFHADYRVDKSQNYPNAEKYYSDCLSIPLFPAMTDEDAKQDVIALRKVLEKA